MGDQAGAAPVSALGGDGRQSHNLVVEIEGDFGVRQKPRLLSNGGGYGDLTLLRDAHARLLILHVRVRL